MTKRAVVGDLSVTLQKLYAAAGDSSLWPEALRSLEDLSGSAGATINFVPTSPQRQGMVLAGRFTADVCEEYARDYMARCPRINFTEEVMTSGGPKIGYDALILTEAEMDRDPVYNWFASLGLRYYIGSVVPSSIDGYHVNFSLQRSIRQGHVQSHDIEMYETLRPHIQQAITLGAQLGSLEVRQSATEALLDRLPQGMIVLGANREILFRNAAADRILIEGVGLTARSNVLTVVPSAEKKIFDRMLQGVAALSSGRLEGLGGWLKINRGLGLSSLSLLVAPLTFDLGLSFASHPVAMVLVRDERSAGGATQQMLRGLFGLTPTEARLATILGEGETLERAAERLGQATGTARIHLKSIFRKMGIGRQQELVGLVTGLISQGFAA